MIYVNNSAISLDSSNSNFSLACLKLNFAASNWYLLKKSIPFSNSSTANTSYGSLWFLINSKPSWTTPNPFLSRDCEFWDPIYEYVQFSPIAARTKPATIGFVPPVKSTWTLLCSFFNSLIISLDFAKLSSKLSWFSTTFKVNWLSDKLHVFAISLAISIESFEHKKQMKSGL